MARRTLIVWWIMYLSKKSAEFWLLNTKHVLIKFLHNVVQWLVGGTTLHFYWTYTILLYDLEDRSKGLKNEQYWQRISSEGRNCFVFCKRRPVHVTSSIILLRTRSRALLCLMDGTQYVTVAVSLLTVLLITNWRMIQMLIGSKFQSSRKSIEGWIQTMENKIKYTF